MKPVFRVGEPRSFEEITYFVENLRDGEPVALNFVGMDANQSQRAVDWLSGACLAICGKSAKIANDIFLFSPPTTTITMGVAA